MQYTSMMAVLMDLDGYHKIEAGWDPFAAIYHEEWTYDEDCPRVLTPYIVPRPLLSRLIKRGFIELIEDGGTYTIWNITEEGRRWRSTQKPKWTKRKEWHGSYRGEYV